MDFSKETSFFLRILIWKYFVEMFQLVFIILYEWKEKNMRIK